ncbi:MAG: hypothetical protein ABH863_03415 [Candidatus Micrarchaeota archaeon]
MLILGFESTAHTFGAAVVESKIGLESPGKKGSASLGAFNAKIRQNASKMSPSNTKILSETDMKYPSLKEGFIPRRLADFHAKNFDSIFEGALAGAKASLSDLDAVCYSYGPGIGHSLHIGYMAARSISVAMGIPLIPVNHALAHIEIARFHSGFKDPLAIYVSGGNTQVLALEKYHGSAASMHGGSKHSIQYQKMHPNSRHYRILGETLDIGLGNCLDQLGRHLQLSPPDAVGVLKAAQKGSTLLDLPYIVKGMNTSYSGMLTAVKKIAAGPKAVNQNGSGMLEIRSIGNIDTVRNSAIPKAEDICLSVQEYAFSMLLETAERALTLTKRKEIVGVGGNYRNKRLKEMTLALAKEHRVKCFFPSFELLGDNAGMITITGALQFASGVYPLEALPNQRARIDAEIIAW